MVVCKTRMSGGGLDKRLVVVCTDNHQHPPTLSFVLKKGWMKGWWLFVQTTTNTHQPFHLTKKGWMKGWWLYVQTTTNTHQPSRIHPHLTDNHQHPPTLSFVKKGMYEGLVAVCTDNHQHPPTPQPSSSYKQDFVISIGRPS